MGSTPVRRAKDGTPIYVAESTLRMLHMEAEKQMQVPDPKPDTAPREMRPNRHAVQDNLDRRRIKGLTAKERKGGQAFRAGAGRRARRAS